MVVQATWQMIAQLQKERTVITVKSWNFTKMCGTKPYRSHKINVVAHEEFNFEEPSTNIEDARNLHVCDDDSSSDEYIGLFYVGSNRKMNLN